MPLINVTINIKDSIYLRDPLLTNLGKNILYSAIELIDEVGLEGFNFKKLANKIESTEASIYRYFENKYKLLAYLVAWYWDFMHFLIIMDTRNISDPKMRLKHTVQTLVNSLDSDLTPDYIDQAKLHRLVVENANKVYHTKNVDKLNEIGFYLNYKKIVKSISETILDIDPQFEYPVALATNIIEQSLSNEYYIEHLPNLTDVKVKGVDPRLETTKMIDYMLKKILR